MRALLDVNALIALLDEEHVHHDAIFEWVNREEVLPHGFATCSITQMGCIRVMSGKGYSKPFEPHEVATKLEHLTRTGHRYLDIPAPCNGRTRWKATTSAQSTDATLLSTAVSHESRLVTFDAGISLKCVAGAKRENLLVLRHGR
jgi:predicted nucleic acid-binding protein